MNLSEELTRLIRAKRIRVHLGREMSFSLGASEIIEVRIAPDVCESCSAYGSNEEVNCWVVEGDEAVPSCDFHLLVTYLVKNDGGSIEVLE